MTEAQWSALTRDPAAQAKHQALELLLRPRMPWEWHDPASMVLLRWAVAVLGRGGQILSPPESPHE
jgi:hypothetical protein